MKILILAVTYRSYDCIGEFLNSINNASRSSDAEVVVAIGDNTDTDYQDIEYTYNNIEVRAFPYHKNLGYLGCALRMLREICSTEAFDYVAVSNVDITLNYDFFSSLSKLNDDNVAWYAPDVYTPSRGTHENPFMIKRPTPGTIRKWMLIYSLPLFFGFIKKLFYMKHSKNNYSESPMNIYAGHGSFMLFSWKFIKDEIDMEFPGFMYEEELFFAEKIRRKGMTIRYSPELKITNIGSVSVTILGNGWQCNKSKESLMKIRDLYFRQ